MTDADRTRILFPEDHALELIRTLPDLLRALVLVTLSTEPPPEAARLRQEAADLAWRLEFTRKQKDQLVLLLDEITAQGGLVERYADALEQATGFSAWHAFCCEADPEPDVDHLYDTHGRRWERTCVDEPDSDGRAFGVTRWIPQRFVLGRWRANPFAPRSEPWHRVVEHAPLFDTPRDGRW